MLQFDAKKIISETCMDTFYDLKKDELISIAKHLELEVKKAMQKHQIPNIIVKHLVSLKVFEEKVLETVETPDSELKKLQLQLEFKKLEMQDRLEMEEKQRQEREQQLQFEREKEERERQERLKEKERQERLERQEKKQQEKDGRKRKTRKKGKKKNDKKG